MGRLLLGLSALRLGLYLLSSGPLAYGYLADEFYYLDGARRLGWGYVDHPPLSVALLRLVEATLGDSLLALRLLPALAHCGTMALGALLAREIGGGRIAQGLAALATLVAPVYLGIAGFYSMNAFEPLFWGAAALVLARLANGSDPRWWLALGAILGLGLLNKVSVLWLGLGIALGLLASRERRWLRTPWPYAAAALAAALFAPYVAWEVAHGWPTLEFMENARAEKMVERTPWGFAAEQLVVMHPLLAPLWIAGLVHYLASEEGRRYRLLAWIWLGAFVLLAASGAVRANYLAPAYVVLLPAGGVVVERAARRPGLRRLPAAAAVAFAAGGAATAPLVIPLLPPEVYLRYQDRLAVVGIAAPVEEQGQSGPMPLHFALRFGWSDMRSALRDALATLTPEERGRAVVLGSWFGDTGMINHARRHGAPFPPAVSGHNHYWLWGPGEASGEVVVAFADRKADRLRRRFRDVRRVAEVGCRYCMRDTARLVVFVCRDPRLPIAEWWPEEREYR